MKSKIQKKALSYPLNNLTKIAQYWGAVAWGNKDKGTYTYDEGGNQITSLIETWERPEGGDIFSGGWVNTTKCEETYTLKK